MNSEIQEQQQQQQEYNEYLKTTYGFDDTTIELYNNLKDYYIEKSKSIIDEEKIITQNFQSFNSNIDNFITSLREAKLGSVEKATELFIIVSYFKTLDDSKKTIEIFLNLFDVYIKSIKYLNSYDINITTFLRIANNDIFKENMDFNIYIFENINTFYYDRIEYFKSYRFLLLLQSFITYNYLDLTFTINKLYYINAILINVERYIYAEELKNDFSNRAEAPRGNGHIVILIKEEVNKEIEKILKNLEEKDIIIKDSDIEKVYNEIIKLKQEFTNSGYYTKLGELRVGIQLNKRTFQYQISVYYKIIKKIEETSTSMPTPSTPSFSMPTFSMPSISIPTPSIFKTKKKSLEEKKAEAKQTIDLAFRDLYKLFEFTPLDSDNTDTTKLKEYIKNKFNENLNKITPKTKSTYTYKSEYLGRETTIDVAFGGENKKKARKLKKYNP